MTLADFYIPTTLLPASLHHFSEHSLIIFPAHVVCTLIKQESDIPTLGVVIYGDREELTAEHFRSRLHDVVVLIAAAFPQAEGYNWLSDKWLHIYKTPERLISHDDPMKFAQNRCREVVPRDQGIQIILDFTNCSIPAAARPEWRFDLTRALQEFLGLDYDGKLKHLVEMFAFATSSPSLLAYTYPNDNLRLSLFWTIIDTLMPSGKIDHPLQCPKCGHGFSESRPTPSKTRIENFVPTLPISGSDEDLMITAFSKLNNRIRNPFYHGAKRTTRSDAAKKLVEKTGKNQFTFAEDIEDGEGRFGGPAIIETLLRRELFDRLNAVNHTKQ